MKKINMKDIGLDRMTEIASWAIEGLIEDDRYSAIEYLHDEIDMTIEELEFFGVTLTREEKKEHEWERTCPVCGNRYSEYPALSRRDNETYICPECGVNEALEDFLGGSK